MIVAEQPLEGGEVRPGFEQVCGVAVAEGMAGDGLGQAGRGPRGDDRALECGLVEGPPGWAGEEPVDRAVVEPVRSEFGQELIRQRHAAVFAALAVTDPEDMTGRVDVFGPEAEDLTDPQPAAVGDAEHESVATRWCGIEESSDLLRCQHDGQ